MVVHHNVYVTRNEARLMCRLQMLEEKELQKEVTERCILTLKPSNPQTLEDHPLPPVLQPCIPPAPHPHPPPLPLEMPTPGNAFLARPRNLKYPDDDPDPTCCSSRRLFSG